MADIPEPVRIALEDVTPVIAAAFADDACLIWSGEHRAYWVAGGNGYTTGAAYAGRWTIADAYRQTKHCDPTKQIAFERVDASRAAPPAMDREAVDRPALLAAARAWWAAKMSGSTCTNVVIKGDGRVDVHWRDADEDGRYTLPVDFFADAIRQGEGEVTEAMIAAGAKAVTDRYYAGGKLHQLTPVKPRDLASLVLKAALACQTCGGSGYTRHLGRDNDEIVEDCPDCTPASHASDGGKA